jgi:hypothetical protein
MNTVTAMTITSEYESGTCTGYLHPHNGYYAGDFGARTPALTFRPVTPTRVSPAHQTSARMGSGPWR